MELGFVFAFACDFTLVVDHSIGSFSIEVEYGKFFLVAQVASVSAKCWDTSDWIGLVYQLECHCKATR